VETSPNSKFYVKIEIKINLKYNEIQIYTVNPKIIQFYLLYFQNIFKNFLSSIFKIGIFYFNYSPNKLQLLKKLAT